MIKKYLLKVYDFVILKWIELKRYIFSDVVVLSIGDIMLVRRIPTHLQLGVASLLLDVEQYAKGDKSLRYQSEGKKLSYGENYDASKDNARFSALIESCIKNGFDKESAIYVDKEIRLFNGTHRTAICLHLGVNEIKARVLRRKEDYIKDVNSFDIIKGPKERNILMSQKLNEIQKIIFDRGMSFCCFLSKKFNNTESVEFDIIHHFHVERVLEVNNADSSICGFDLSEGGRLYLFSLDNPRYKCVDSCIESQETKDVCLKLQEKYGIGNSQLLISHSCYEGKKIYDALTPFF